MSEQAFKFCANYKPQAAEGKQIFVIWLIFLYAMQFVLDYLGVLPVFWLTPHPDKDLLTSWEGHHLRAR